MWKLILAICFVGYFINGYSFILAEGPKEWGHFVSALAWLFVIFFIIENRRKLS